MSRVTIDDLYRRLTQFRLWSYTEELLGEAKAAANEQGRSHALRRFEEAKAKIAGENKLIFDLHGHEFTAEKLLDTLSLEEETKYLHFYCKNILETGKFFNMPTQVKASAISFFRKFYLVNSAMEYHPKNVLYTVLFLAAKLENYFISIESFCKGLPKVEPKDILDLEFVILQLLKFTLFVHHPFRPLYGLFLDMQAVLLHTLPVLYDVNIDHLGSLYDKAKRWLIDYAVLSDVPFLFTPPQIALAALYDLDKKNTERYLRRKFVDEPVEEKNLDTIEEEEEWDDDNPNKKRKTTAQLEEEERERKLQQEEEQKRIDDEKRLRREMFDNIIRSIKRCAVLAKQVPETTREESVAIDKKCFFTLNPNKTIKKKLKQYK